MDQNILDKLAFRSEQGEVIRSWCRHEGFGMFQKLIKERLEALQQSWFKADDVEAQKIKIRAQIYNEVLDAIKTCIISGDVAKQNLERFKAEE